MSSYGANGKVKLIPSLTPYLGTQMLIPTRKIQWNRYCIDRENKINTGMVSISTSKGKNSVFVLSVDGMLGKEDLVVLANLSWIMAVKMEAPTLHMRVWINIRISISVARFYSCMIRGSRLPSTLRGRDTDWESGSGLGLAQQIAFQNRFPHTRAILFCILPKLASLPLPFTIVHRVHTTLGQRMEASSEGS